MMTDIKTILPAICDSIQAAVNHIDYLLVTDPDMDIGTALDINRVGCHLREAILDLQRVRAVAIIHGKLVGDHDSEATR